LKRDFGVETGSYLKVLWALSKVELSHLCAESDSHRGYCDYQTSKAIFTKNIKQLERFGKFKREFFDYFCRPIKMKSRDGERSPSRENCRAAGRLYIKRQPVGDYSTEPSTASL
jgi:hypothetical protein